MFLQRNPKIILYNGFITLFMNYVYEGQIKANKLNSHY